MPIPAIAPVRARPIQPTGGPDPSPTTHGRRDIDHLGPGRPIGLDSASADHALFKRMLRGQLGVAEGMARVAANQGWPIETAQGYIVACPAGAGEVRLAGTFNGWRPQPMNRTGELCWAVIPKQAEPQRYKLVVGGDFRADPWSRCYGVDDRGEYALTHAHGVHHERWFAVTDGTVSPRTVRVFVPAEPPTHHLYVHDGQSLFHGGWELDRQVGPRTLVIGIETIKGRFEDLTPMTDIVGGEVHGGRGAAYADFVERYLRPRIEARYGRPAKVGVMGASLGGVMALYQSLRFPDAYDVALSLSGTVGWGALAQRGETLIDWFGRATPGRAKLYLDSGGNPGAGDNYDDNRRLLATLRRRGWRDGEELRYWHEPGAPHHHAAWRDRLHRPLAWFEGR